MRKFAISVITGFMFLAMSACLQPPDYPFEPVIAFKSISKNLLSQNEQDTFLLTFTFTDGDGDLGSSDSLDIRVIDTRTGFDEVPSKIPVIPALGVDNGISGEIAVQVRSSCCQYSPTDACFPNPQQPRDTMSYRIQIRDRAGNWSNTIETPPIYLICN